MSIGCVLMAAGLSTRFGADKLLHPLTDGRPLLAHTLDALPRARFARAVAVVSGEGARALVEAAGFEAVINPHPEAGQGSSIALGAARVLDLEGALFCVADQPHLTRASVGRLLDAFAPGRYVALAWRGKRGNPVLFPREGVAELARVAPEQTGRVVLARHMERLVLVEAGDARELFDVDTREDLGR